MLQIKNVVVHGLERALVAAGNPMTIGEIDSLNNCNENDRLRGKRLGSLPVGSGHNNFLKGVIVQFDVKYPQYWSLEAQRYHWLDIISSQSKMHRLSSAGSSEEFHKMFNKYVDKESIDKIKYYIYCYNHSTPIQQDNCSSPTSAEEIRYHWFMKALSNLPMGYELWETISTSYLQLKTIYKQRQNHKLREDWGAFCKMCENLPFFLELIGEKTASES